VASSGGGILSDGTLLITHSTLSGNSVNGSPASGFGFGGGIHSRNLTMTDSTLSSNFASGSGGGIYLIPLQSTSITNSTLRGNSASDGGGIYVGGAFTLMLTNSTVSGNLAAQSGGSGGITVLDPPGLIPPGQVILQNTILAQNTTLSGGASPDCVTLGGQVTSLGHNLLGNLTGCRITLTLSDRIGDPGLGPFTDNGTPGQGYVPLLPTSRAINAGDLAACPATDQLGQPRGSPCDIGAVEFAPVTLTLGLNQTTLRPGETLRVRLGIHTRGPAVTADVFLGILLPDGVTVLFVTRLAPLDGVVTRLDADPRTFAPLAPAHEFPSGLEITVEDFLVYTLTGAEAPGPYAIFTLLTRPGAFADGQVDAGDLLGLTQQLFTVSP
jgi:predicted outer membrane repeat protein